MRARHALEHALLQCTEGLRSGSLLSLTVQCVPQVKMGRSRGVGMPRAKKKKVEPHKEAGPSEAEPAPAAVMPPPPPRSPEPSRRPALPQSPARKAAQEANLVLREALKKQKAAGKWLRRADTLITHVYEMRSEMHIKVEKALKNKAQAKKRCLQDPFHVRRSRAIVA